MEKTNHYTLEELLATLEPPRCEYRLQTNRECADVAHWLLAPTCGDSLYLCDAHQAQMKAWLSSEEDEYVRCRMHPELGPIGLTWVRV